MIVRGQGRESRVGLDLSESGVRLDIPDGLSHFADGGGTSGLTDLSDGAPRRTGPGSA